MEVDLQMVIGYYETKVIQLMRDCAALTAENLELIKKLEELQEKKDGIE